MKKKRGRGAATTGIGHAGLTKCKLCGRSIFDQEDREWVRTPAAVGLAHTSCAAEGIAKCG